LSFLRVSLVVNHLRNIDVGRIHLPFSAASLWKAVKEIYGNQNNSTCIFHIDKNLANLQQDGNTYVQLLETLEGMTSELALYRPYTVDAAKLRIHEEEDKIFQLLASLSSKYEDLHIKILMNPDFQSLTSVCATIQ